MDSSNNIIQLYSDYEYKNKAYPLTTTDAVMYGTETLTKTIDSLVEQNSQQPSLSGGGNGATSQQIQQIEKNTEDIASLKTNVTSALNNAASALNIATNVQSQSLSSTGLAKFYFGHVHQADTGTNENPEYIHECMNESFKAKKFKSCNLIVPYYNAKFYAKCPTEYKIQVGFSRYGTQGPGYVSKQSVQGTGKINMNKFWESSAEAAYADEDPLYYNRTSTLAVYIERNDGAATTSSVLNTLIDNGDIEIYYVNQDMFDVVQRNVSIESDLRANMMYHKKLYNHAFSFVHVSDVHGDSLRYENAVKYAKYLNVPLIDSGDGCLNSITDSTSFMHQIDKAYGIEAYHILGNHDAIGPGLAGKADNSTDAQNINYVENLKANIDLSQSWRHKCIHKSNETDTWYYVDFPRLYMSDVKVTNDTIAYHDIRVIFLDEDPIGEYGAKQLKWFIETLNDLKDKPGYGFICVMHGVESRNSEINTAMDPNWAPWQKHVSLYNKTAEQYNPSTNISTPQDTAEKSWTGKHFFSEIIDAWCQGKSGKISIPTPTSFKGINGTETFSSQTISYDFSWRLEKNSSGSFTHSGEFICWVTGHAHRDIYGWSKNTDVVQSVLNIGATTANHRSPFTSSDIKQTDLPRETMPGVTQDAFNVVTVDRWLKRLRITRVGANVTVVGEPRKTLQMNYRIKNRVGVESYRPNNADFEYRK